jgi:hypothetical protein
MTPHADFLQVMTDNRSAAAAARSGLALVEAVLAAVRRARSGCRGFRRAQARAALSRDLLAVITGLRPGCMLDYVVLPPAALCNLLDDLARLHPMAGTPVQPNPHAFHANPDCSMRSKVVGAACICALYRFPRKPEQHCAMQAACAGYRCCCSSINQKGHHSQLVLSNRVAPYLLQGGSWLRSWTAAATCCGRICCCGAQGRPVQ